MLEDVRETEVSRRHRFSFGNAKDEPAIRAAASGYAIRAAATGGERHVRRASLM